MRLAAKPLLLTLLCLISATPLQGQGTSRLRVDGERTKSYIAHLSTPEMLGRQSMTPGYQAAAEWVAEQYRAWGLEPAGDDGTYFQRVPHARSLSWNEGVPELRVAGSPLSLLEGDFSLHASSTVGTSVDSEVVFVGYGISAPGKGLDEYEGIDVRGKTVLALTGSPSDAPEPGGFGSMGAAPREGPGSTEEWAAESEEITKIRTAFEHGAAAILLYDPDGPEETPFPFGGRREPQETFAPPRNFLTFTVTDRAFRAIMKPDPQESVRGFTTRLTAIRNEIKHGTPQSEGTGVEAHLKGYDRAKEYNEELGNNYAYNVLAKLPGTDPARADELIVMGGHLDHLGVRNGQIYNGADDNASGTAVAMEVARVLREGGFRSPRTIIFAAWCGEEMGLYGSNYFVANPPEGVDIDKVVTYFNMDMVGLGDAIDAPGALNFPSIWEVIERDQDADVIAAVHPSTGGPGGSDHSAFITRGIEAMALMTSGGTGHPFYHQPEDDTEKIEAEILRKVGQFVLQGAVNLAREEEANLLIEDRETLYNAMQLEIDSFNPGQGNYLRVALDARDKDALTALVLDSALATTARLREEAQQPQQPMAQMFLRFGRAPRGNKTFNRGINQLQLFQGDLPLLLAASEFIGFGRLDVEGDDGHWFQGGRLTQAGREAVRILEENEIWIHLASPSEGLLQEMLALASKPFIVSGDYSVPPSMAGAINQKGVVLAVTVDPSNVDQAVRNLVELKVLLGDTDNLALSVTTDEGLDEAQRALYMGLLGSGWEHLDIVGDRRAGGGIAGGNLRAFGGMPMRPYMR